MTSIRVEYHTSLQRLLFSLIVVLVGAGLIIPFLPNQLVSIILIIPFVLLITSLLVTSLKAYQFALGGFIFILFGAFDIIGYKPVSTNPINIFFVDVIVLLLLILILRILFSRDGFLGQYIRNLSSPITGLLLLNFLYGLFSIAFGATAGYGLNNVMGDFRRFYFYPLSTLIGLSFLSKPREFYRLLTLFSASLVVIVSIGLIRVTTGQTFDPAQFVESGDFRAISYFSGVIVLMGISLLYGLSLRLSGSRKFGVMAFVVILIGISFVSGYRLLWLLTLLLLPLVSFLSFRGGKRLVKLISAVILILLFVIIVLLCLRFLFPDWYLFFVDKLTFRVLEFDFQSSIRYFAWRAALTKFFGSPIFGVGLGHQFEFLAYSSQGLLYTSKLTTHNIILSILYQTGIIGGILFILINFRILGYVWKLLPRCDSKDRGLIAGMFASYLAALAMAMFQPLLESPGAVVGFYLWIGIMLRATQISARNIFPLPDIQNVELDL